MTGRVWRVGPPLGRTIWQQIGEHPGPLDIYVGVMDADELAAKVVEAMNLAEQPEPEPVLEPELTMAEELRMVINKHSLENNSNTPDLVLMQFMLGCLASFNQATRDRDKWYGIKPEPGNPS